MSKIKIVTDSASDIPFKHEDLYDIQVVPFKITLGDETYISRVELQNNEFYELLAETGDFPKTESLSPFDFGELYGDLFEQGYTDIIYVAVNSEGSATYENSVLARKQFFEDNPDAADKLNIYCIDSGTYSAGYGWAVVEAAKMADKGVFAPEIVKFLENRFKNCVIYFGLFDLKYAKRSDIIEAGSGFMGLRPIMKVGKKSVTTEATVRRESAILPLICELCTEEIQKGSPYCIIYGNDADIKDNLASLLTKTLGYPPTDTYQAGAVTACHTGYEIAGVVFEADKEI